MLLGHITVLTVEIQRQVGWWWGLRQSEISRARGVIYAALVPEPSNTFGSLWIRLSRRCSLLSSVPGVIEGPGT